LVHPHFIIGIGFIIAYKKMASTEVLAINVNKNPILVLDMTALFHSLGTQMTIHRHLGRL